MNTYKKANSMEDNKYKFQLSQEPWLEKNDLIDIDLIQEHLPSFKYFYEQNKILEDSCSEKVFNHVLSKPNLFQSKNAKNLVRSGVPPKYLHDFLLKLCDIKEFNPNNFNSKYEYTFKNHDPKNLDDFVPFFTGFKTFKESLPIHYLNEKGLLAVKEILWMVDTTYANIEFSPIIIQLISIILVFCSKEETYEIICKILEQDFNIKETGKIRWRLRFNYNDNIKMITSISECLKEISTNSGKDVYEHFQKINFRPEELYEDICFGFFYKHFNFFGMIRLLPFFLLEGVKSFYRLIYAIEKLLRDEIKKWENKNEIIPKVRELLNTLENIGDLFEISYTFKLTRNNNKYDFQSPPEDKPFINKRNQYYLPRISGEGNLLTDWEIIHLWELLPFEFTILDMKLIYRGDKDGYDLKKILGLEEIYPKHSNILFLIETLEDEKFGFAMDHLVMHTDNKYLKPGISVLFTIKPKLEIFKPENGSEEILYFDTKTLIFGNGSNGPAIHLDQDLIEGETNEGTCFKNPSLVKGNNQFKIKKIEIYKLE
jgi:hypothetical protein